MITKYKKLVLFAPIPGMIVGISVTAQHHIPITPFISNFIGVMIGMPLCLLISKKLPFNYRQMTLFSLLSLGVMFSSLFFAGTEGIHRWITLGSISINISMILCPFVLYSIYYFLYQQRFLFSLFLTFSTSLLHVMQPDAGQAFSFGIATISLYFLCREIPNTIRILGIIISLLSITLAWQQPDSLAGVSQVEYILILACQGGALDMANASFALFLLVIPILNDKYNTLTIVFIAYLLSAFFITTLGNYPVPILGAGLSSVFGWYILLGLIKSKHPKEKSDEKSIPLKKADDSSSLVMQNIRL